MPDARINGVRIWYKEIGQGEPVIRRFFDRSLLCLRHVSCDADAIQFRQFRLLPEDADYDPNYLKLNPKDGVPTLVHDGNRRLELAGRRERLPDEALDGVSQRPMLGHSLQQASAASNSICGAGHSKEPSGA
jgi:hypothetical protein